ncbi:MAG TPA: DegQ family serine endoprotease [Pyrinomonadaceae bacterium]|nr:DegQ family serine endoprotease [Pyrinomonadaceae bacterium]
MNSFQNLRLYQTIRQRRIASAVVVASLLFCLSVAAVACKGKAETPAVNYTRVPDSAPQNSYADVVSHVAPAVVTIHANKRVRQPQQFPFFDDPFGGLFGNRNREQQQPREQLERALGSGVIVSADGYIITNHHVVDGAEEIKIDLTDGRTVDAKLVGSDAPSDLAVLKIAQSGLPFLTPGDSDKVRVGDVALAIGNPLNVGQTVTMGIISAKGRATGLGSGAFEDFLQTDAPINQGNSGGALVNTNGDLIGINSQILGGTTGGNIGIGFAIPSNMVKTVMDQLIKSGKVRRGQLGIVVRRVDSDMAESLGMSETKGIIVNSVTPGSAAQRAGIRQGDVIIALDGAPVNEVNAFRNRIASSGPGAQVTLTILRDNREQKITATTGEFKPEGEKTDQGETGPGATGQGRLGLSVIPLTPEISSELNLPAGTKGVVVDSVDPAGPAASTGLARGDVIQEVNRQPISSAEDLRAAIDKNGNKPALLLINRRGQQIYVTVRPRP